jgi:protein ImuB
MLPKRILCIHLPNWPIQRLRAARKAGQVSNLSAGGKVRRMGQKRAASAGSPPAASDGGPAAAKAALSHPTILHARDPRRGELVVACNPAATAHGVRLGMPLAEASTLVSRDVPHQPDASARACILPHDPAADLAALAKLAEHCERFSPIVGWETVEGGVPSGSRKSEVGGRKSSTGDMEPGTGNSLFLDVTGIGVLFGGEETLAQEVVADLSRLGYEGHVAIAGTIGAAWAIAGMQKAEGRTQSEKPNSEFCILHSEIAALRLPAETLDLLSQLGLTQIEHLLALPRTSLRARFGERLLLRLDQLTGAAQETIVAHRPPPQFAAERVLEYPVERREVIEQLVRELLQGIAQALAERREGIVQLHVRLDCAPGRPVQIDIGLFRPSADPRHLWSLARMQLEQTALPGPVGRVTLEARLTAPLENRQGELFAGNQHEAQRQFGLLIDRLSSRLGPQAVLQSELTADPLPERAVRWISAVKPVAKRFKVQSSKFKVKERRRTTLNLEPRTWNLSHRPLTLLAPVALEVLSVVPDGPPITFRWQGQQHRVVRHWGPERIETGWWRGASVRRDYYRVETTTGQRFWLFRQLGDCRWHLHGEFS